MSIADEVEKTILPELNAAGYELVNILFGKEHKEYFLRIFIDKPGGVSLDDCALVSEKVGKILDAADLIHYSYHLEVSSPGLNRPLKKIADFKKFQGKKARITTFGPISGQRNFLGEIGEVSEISVELSTDKGKISIPFSIISKAKLEEIL